MRTNISIDLDFHILSIILYIILSYIISIIDFDLYIFGINTYIKLIINFILLKYILNIKVRIYNNNN